MTRLNRILLFAAAAISGFVHTADAGPNQDGVLILHADETVIYTSDDDPEEHCGTGPVACSDVDIRIDSLEPVVFWVYASFPEQSSPRVKALAFGIDYDPASLTPALAFEGCDSSFESPGWPAPGTGISMLFSSPRTSTFFEIGYFAWESNGTPATFDLIAHPTESGGAVFLDDSVPSQRDPIADLGSMGFFVDGYKPCTVSAELPELEQGLRDVSELRPGWVVIALGAESADGDYIEETLPFTNSLASMDSVFVMTSPAPPDSEMVLLPSSSRDVVYDPVDRVLRVTDAAGGEGFHAISYKVDGTTPPSGIIGTTSLAGNVAASVEVGDFRSWVLDTLGSAYYETTLAATTADWACEVDVSNLPGVTINNVALDLDGNAGDDESDKKGGASASAFATGNEAHAYVGCGAPAGTASALAWVGTAFRVRGTDPRPQVVEQDTADLKMQLSHHLACQWDMEVGIPFTEIQGGAETAFSVRWEVLEYEVIDGTICESAAITLENQSLVVPTNSDGLLCKQTDGTSTPIADDLLLREDRVYLARLILYAYGATILGGIETVLDAHETDCQSWGPDCDSGAGVDYTGLDVDWSNDPLPELVVDPNGISTVQDTVVAGSVVTIGLGIVNYGAADALAVPTKIYWNGDLIDPDGDGYTWFYGFVAKDGGGAFLYIDHCATGVIGPQSITAEIDPFPDTIEERCEQDGFPLECEHTAAGGTYLEAATTIVTSLVFDLSNSMSNPDSTAVPTYRTMGLAVSDAWIDLQSDTTSLGVVNFAREANPAMHVNRMTPTWKDAAHQKAGRYFNAGSTWYSNMYDAIDAGIDQLTCAPSDVKVVIVISDGSENVDTGECTRREEVIQRASEERVPIVIVQPLPLLEDGKEQSPDCLPYSEQKDAFWEIATKTGGAVYELVDDEVETAIDIANQIWKFVQEQVPERHSYGPIRQPLVEDSGTDQHVGSLNFMLTSELPLTFSEIGFELDPPIVSLAGIPPIDSHGFDLGAPSIQGDRLVLPILDRTADPGTAVITFGSGTGLPVHTTGLVGNVEATFFIDGAPSAYSPILGVGTSGPEVTNLSETSVSNVGDPTPLTVYGVNFLAVESVEIEDILDAENRHILTLVQQLSSREVETIVPSGLPEGTYDVVLEFFGGSSSNRPARHLLLVSDFDPTDVEGPSDEPQGPRVDRTLLLGTRPNPLAARGEVLFQLRDPGVVRLDVYDVRGRRVRSLVDTIVPAGVHSVPWKNGTKDERAVPPGAYFVRLWTEAGVFSERVVVLR